MENLSKIQKMKEIDKPKLEIEILETNYSPTALSLLNNQGMREEEHMPLMLYMIDSKRVETMHSLNSCNDP